MKVIPKKLEKGDKIGILSTARKISKQELKPAIELIKKWGYEPVLGKSIDAGLHQFAGSKILRAEDLQNFIDDREIKAILCARGGYGTVRIIDDIDFNNLKKYPKWIIGYSDVTVLHNQLNNINIASLHATMPINFPKDKQDNASTNSLKKVLAGEKIYYKVENSHKLNREGTAQAELVGGNLSIIYSLLGSKSSISTKDKILFLEDLDEYLYHIDRMMINLKRNHLLDNLAGLIIGGMSSMNDNTIAYGKNAYEIIQEHIQEFEYPVLFNFNAGHIEPNLALKLGTKLTLKVDETSSLIFD